MARKITEVTRRRILDRLIAEEVNLYGCFEEIDFLARIWDLDAMHSTDPRFNNAAGDIWQHRVNNADWEDSWLFYDSRLGLMVGEDDIFLRFLCEMVHPAVRPDAVEAARLCELCNRFLHHDGYELVEKSQAGGRPVYCERYIGASKTPRQVVLMGLERSVYTRIVRLVLAEKGVDYTFREVDVFAERGAPLYYFKHHPFARIPAFSHGDFAVYETGAITRYIDEAFAGPGLQPDAPSPRARMNQIISVMDAYAYRPMVWDVFVERIVKPQEGGGTDESVIAAALPPIRTCLNELESFLSGKFFFCGERLTLADLHAAPIVLYFSQTPEGERMLASRTHLLNWLQRMQARPAMTATQSVYG